MGTHLSKVGFTPSEGVEQREIHQFKFPQRQRIAGNGAVVEVAGRLDVPYVACGRSSFEHVVPQRQRIAGNGAVVEVAGRLDVPYVACGRSGFECAVPQRQRVAGNGAVVEVAGR